jgi:hypothetical protein
MIVPSVAGDAAAGNASKEFDHQALLLLPLPDEPYEYAE